MIVVPYHLGRRDVEVGRGPAKILAATGIPSTVVERTNSAIGELDAVADVNLQLARAVAAGSRPVVLAGNCNSCLGTLAGISREDLGVIWFDAHGDFNTPETSISGALEGMSLAIATGACHHELRQRIGLIRPVSEANVLLVATRDLDPEEEVRLERSAVSVIGLDDLPGAMDRLARRVGAVYLHLDLDVLDPRASPGVNFSAPGGIDPQGLFDAVRHVGAAVPLAAAAIANFNPERDIEDRTLKIAHQLVGILGEASLT
jgi:arginase